MRYADTRVRSVAEFLEQLKPRQRLKQPIWYRGQEKATWDLKPTIDRCGGIKSEAPLMTRFKQNALALIENRPESEWEWLFVMRHHGVPTRLLDWSENPLVGLYFAVTGNPKADGALWNLLPIELNKVARFFPPHPHEIPGFGDHKFLQNYLPSVLSGEQSSSLSPAAAIAPRNTRRMQAQQGVFTITHREQVGIETVGDQSHIWRIIIPKGAKTRIQGELAAFNINRLSLFPELDHVAEYAKEMLG
jgi:hypothetical protein